MNKKAPKRQKAGMKNPSITKTAATERWKYYSALAVILLLAFIVYLPVLQNSLIDWDDHVYINNNLLLHSFNLKEIFSRYVSGNYHPFTILTLALEYQLFGLNATGYHAVNLLLHLVNIILVFYTVFLISDKAGVALVAALIFGIHPMHVESVAWAAELKDLLYTAFFLASYIFYLKYLKDPQKKLYIYAILLFLFSLLSKAMAASLPVVLLLTDYFKGRKLNKKTILEKVPFFLLAILFGVVALIAQKSSGAVSDNEILTFPQRLVFASYGFITYLLKLIFPLHLSAFYPYPIKSGGDIPILYYSYVLIFLGFAAFVIYSLRFSKKIFFGIGFFAVTVFLVLQLLPVGGAIMADRYSYIPSIGIFYLAGEGFNLLWNKKIKLIAVILLSAFTIFYSVKTYARCGVWKNEITLWNDVINQYQTVPTAYNNRGSIYARGQKYDWALPDFNKAIELKSNYFEAYINRGSLFMVKGNYDKAIADFDKAIELNSNSFEAYYSRGTLFLRAGNYDKALPDFDKAIELNPKRFETYFNRGNLFLNEKKYDKAIADFDKVIELKADYAEAYYNRGMACHYSGKNDAACMNFKKAANLGHKDAANSLQQFCK
jgi:tetratricopeptide (TPR) repeat protein